MNKKVKLQSEFKIFPDIIYQHYHKKTNYILYTYTLLLVTHLQAQLYIQH